jgi:hypothetical protein
MVLKQTNVLINTNKYLRHVLRKRDSFSKKPSFIIFSRSLVMSILSIVPLQVIYYIESIYEI